jgi:hypothetical protein
MIAVFCRKSTSGSVMRNSGRSLAPDMKAITGSFRGLMAAVVNRTLADLKENRNAGHGRQWYCLDKSKPPRTGAKETQNA